MEFTFRAQAMNLYLALLVIASLTARWLLVRWRVRRCLTRGHKWREEINGYVCQRCRRRWTLGDLL